MVCGGKRIGGELAGCYYVEPTVFDNAHRLARQLQAGSVWINQLSDISPQGPYGGYKQCGFGRTGGLAGLYEFLQVKDISHRHELRVASNDYDDTS